jgi:hypothetical protein
MVHILASSDQIIVLLCRRIGLLAFGMLWHVIDGERPVRTLSAPLEHQAKLVDTIRLNSSASVTAWPSPVAKSNQILNQNTADCSSCETGISVNFD